MSAFFMFILFILNILTVLAIIILFQRQNRLKQAERIQKESVAEMEELLAAFMMEMKEENDLLLKKVRQLKAPAGNAKSSPTVGAAEGEKLSSKKKTTYEAEQPNSVILSKNFAISAYKKQPLNDETEINSGYQPAGLKEEEDKVDFSVLDNRENPTASNVNIDSNDTDDFKAALKASLAKGQPTLSEQIFQMHEQGMTIDQIAKKLNRGKTEIELLLKFQR
ncbi:DUF6115 domain-containing protein [Bacillus sp. V5-8f]|uniref:DUF6115 domain-containing protein n=1 Tax=Bacillus sp. V5-8f TaxID=2053044 RepID=UPI000C75615D|nr:helix-turn-helix domain-containing protein [Bacillus sp. V5-8f]PLT34187.1 hypothetical protein CUU64_08105 [Bacillus sp. V5-8f]